ncbi:MAG TPA: hypothetical protein VE987_09555 [Polyangiaceae bacterium]|nr:hypothetical protein [Polyangiaceae bacterium]
MWGRRHRAALAGWCAALCVALGAPGARAQGGAAPAAEDLAAARALFTDALHDEEAKRFGEALQKFLRVRAVKDTAAVEYRVGTCHEGLGQTAAAYAAYRAAVALGQAEPRSADVVQAALERLDDLSKHVARLTLTLPATAPADTEVRVDDVAVARATLSEPIVLAPGVHVVTASARGASPFRSEITLAEGAGVALAIPIEPGPPTAPAAPQEQTAALRPAGPQSAASNPPTAGWVLVAGGGVLAVVAAALAVDRAAKVATLRHDCPGGLCPPGSNESALESVRNAALVEGPLAVALGAAGVVGVGVGVYFVVGAGAASPAGGSAAAGGAWASARGASLGSGGGVVVDGAFP